MKDPPIGFQKAFSHVFLVKNAVFMSENERSDQVTSKSTPLYGGPNLDSGPKNIFHDRGSKKNIFHACDLLYSLGDISGLTRDIFVTFCAVARS